MVPDRSLGGVALNPPRVSQSAGVVNTDRRNSDTSTRSGDLAVSGPLSSAPDALTSRSNLPNVSPEPLEVSSIAASPLISAGLVKQHPQSYERNDRSAPSRSQSNPNSQDTSMTGLTTQIYTPPESDTSAGVPDVSDAGLGHSSQDSQLHRLSEIAAARDRIATDGGNSRKRMADGAVKTQPGSTSPAKGHSRNTSTVSRASTASSHIGELSSELRTRLSYAMVKVNNGWQSHSLGEVESLASQAASPTSSSSTVHRQQGSSASPRINVTPAIPQVPFSQGTVAQRRKSTSPPNISSSKPSLAPPATIQPSFSMAAPRSNPRRNSNPRHLPATLPTSNSVSPYSPARRPSLQSGQIRTGAGGEPVLFSPHKNVREQDAIETLLFMSSPGNSANLKHALSPTSSPDPQSIIPQSASARHALPSGPRKVLAPQKATYPNKKVEFDRSPGLSAVPNSPMDLDSPQQPSRGTPRGRANGGRSHLRGALSLPSGLGLGNGTTRKILRDEDIERMLDEEAEATDSSDDGEIQLPQNRNGVAGVVRV